ncbi:MAG TPA: hypothetical protein VGN84_05685 [Solirubrobacterales bacterium]|jgi:hypothetical protein|nr:hypothetical protein [Solirubrobacterales bacterium]
MTIEPPLSMEMVAADAICVAPKSREVLEAELGEDVAPLSDEAVLLENMIAMVNRHGLLVAQLAIVPDTRAELLASMPDAVKRVPAWMEAREEESNSEAIAAVGQAIAAHAEALVEIARNFDQLRGELRDPR